MTPTYRPALAAALIAALSVGAPAMAHHSFSATYHIDRQVSIKGEVVQFMFRNPHSFIQIMAPDKSGQMRRFAVEWAGGGALGRERVTSTTLKPGDKVEIMGNPGRTEADRRIRLQRIVRPSDGWRWEGEFG